MPTDKKISELPEDTAPPGTAKIPMAVGASTAYATLETLTERVAEEFGYPLEDTGTDGQVLTSDGAGGASFEDPTSGSGIWSADRPPSSPNALDYEGGDVSAWTEHDFASRMLAPYNANGHMVLEYTAGNGATTWAGAYRAVPASGQYTIIAKIHGVHGVGNFQRTGLALFQDATNTGDMQVIQAVIGNGVYDTSMTAYNTGESTLDSKAGLLPTYFRWRVNGTAIVGGVSNDGISWYEFAPRASGFTPAYFGPVVASDYVSVPVMYTKMRFCRVFDGVYGRDSVTLGGGI